MSSGSHHRHRHRRRPSCSAPSCSSRRPAAPTCAAPARCRARPASATRTPRSTCRRAPTGRDVERAAVASRSTAVVKADDLAAVPWVPPDPEAIGVSRRMFFNRAYVSLMGLGVGGFAAAVVRRLPVADRQGRRLRRQGQRRQDRRHHPQHPPQQRLLLPARGAHLDHRLPGRRAAEGQAGVPAAVLLPGMEAGIAALYQKCPHLGCRVPNCASSQWFECPCHGSQYNRVGEKKAGPAPRGMDRFIVSVSGSGDVTIDTLGGAALPGPADRHQHHRPRGRGSPLHHRRTLTHMLAANTTALAYILLVILVIGFIVVRVREPQPGRDPSWARRSSWPPTAGRTTTTKSSRAPGSSGCSSSACCSSSSASSACRCTGCSSPLARRVRSRTPTSGPSGGARICSRPPPTAASTAPAATAA